MHERGAAGRSDLVDDADVSEAAPRGRLAEEDQVAGTGTRAQRPACTREPVDVGDAVFARARGQRGEIDALATVDDAGETGTIVVGVARKLAHGGEPGCRVRTVGDAGAQVGGDEKRDQHAGGNVLTRSQPGLCVRPPRRRAS